MKNIISDTDKKISCAFTGHRFIKSSKFLELSELLDDKILEIAGQGYKYFLCGGALGFDTLAATSVLRAKKIFKDIKLYLVLPCKTQQSKWRNNDKVIYEKILELADNVFYIGDSYTPGCLMQRNRALVDNSDLLVSYVVRDFGGSHYTKNYAISKNKENIELANYSLD